MSMSRLGQTSENILWKESRVSQTKAGQNVSLSVAENYAKLLKVVQKLLSLIEKTID